MSMRPSQASSPYDAPPASQSNLSQPRIRTRGLRKEFGGRKSSVTAIDGLDLEIPTGQFFVVVGPSGCGKTTLLRILAGLETPTSGTIEVAPGAEGKPTNSMIFQGDSIFPWMTVAENAGYGLRMRGLGRAERQDRVAHYLQKTGLSKFADSYPHELSGGMKQRVSIARAFANDPDIFLMDEPFSALDEQTKTILQQELLKIWDESKKTVVFITHSVDEAVILGDRVMVMTARPGRLKAFVDIPFERPRQVLELRKEPLYGEKIFAIWDRLREEVDAARLQNE